MLHKNYFFQQKSARSETFVFQKERQIRNYHQQSGQQQVRIPPVTRKQPLASMDFSIKNPGQKTRKALMP